MHLCRRMVRNLTHVRETSAAIGLKAAEWAIRVDHAPLSLIEEAELGAWLAKDIRNAGAFARAQAILSETRRIKALGPSMSPGSPVPEAVVNHGDFLANSPGHFDRRRILVGAGAGAVAASIPAAIWLQSPHEEEFATRLGEVRTVSLPDGTRMTLNTATSAKVRFSAAERWVDLQDGEALFDVTKDPARPFIVSAGAALVRVVGTSFTLRRINGAPVELLVREGTVELKRAGSNDAARLVSANMRVVGAGTGLDQPSEIDDDELQRELAWREGLLSFEDQTLEDIARQFERYNHVRIIFADPGIAQQTITGVFAANEPVAFANAASLSLGLKLEASSEAIMLRR